MPTKRLAGLAAFAALLTFTPAAAQEDDAFVTHRSLKPELALQVVTGALEDCRARGYQVAVTVVDRFGGLQAAMRDRFAGPHTPDTSRRKAWTAISFRTDTLELSKLAESGEAWGLRLITDALPLGGGVRITAGDGDMIGAVGVSGAPSGAEDEACAKAGIAAIEDQIAF